MVFEEFSQMDETKRKYTVKTTMTKELYEYGNRGFQKINFKSGGWKIWGLFAIGIPLSGAGTFFAGGAAGRVYSFVFGVLIMIFLPMLAVHLWGRFNAQGKYNKIVKQMENNIDQEYGFFEDYWTVKRWYSEEIYSYSSMSCLFELPKMFMMITSEGVMYYFWKNEISADSFREFREFLEKKSNEKAQFVAMR